MLREMAKRKQMKIHYPPVRLCTDNAVMVAWAAIEGMRAGNIDIIHPEEARFDEVGSSVNNPKIRVKSCQITPIPRWPLDREDGMHPFGVVYPQQSYKKRRGEI